MGNGWYMKVCVLSTLFEILLVEILLVEQRSEKRIEGVEPPLD